MDGSYLSEEASHNGKVSALGTPSTPHLAIVVYGNYQVLSIPRNEKTPRGEREVFYIKEVIL